MDTVNFVTHEFSGVPSAAYAWARSNLDDGNYLVQYAISRDDFAFTGINPSRPPVYWLEEINRK